MSYKFNAIVTSERLRELLTYDPDTGLFKWNMRVSTRRDAGSIAGSKNWAGYICTRIDGKYYMGHRLAWLYVHGRWPTYILDHINRIRSDNRLCNLRECTEALNSRNNTGLGYSVLPSGNFCATISVNRRTVSLGTFATAEEARAAFLAARIKICPQLGEHPDLIEHQKSKSR